MMSKKNIFVNKNKKLKPFLLAFSAFIIILAVCSVFLFMNSIDYDFDNIFGNTTEEQTETTEKPEQEKFFVSSLSGKSNILFAVKGDDGSFSSAFLVLTDFDDETMMVELIDDCAGLSSSYKESSDNGLKNFITSLYGVNIDKYAIFEQKQFKNVLSMFDGITITFDQPVDYKSHEFNLKIDSGVQTISGDMAYKYFSVIDNSQREKVLCEIIYSVLSPEYVEKSDVLFKEFVNSCVTDISIIDYSEAIDDLKIYSNAEDKFLPTPYIVEE